MRAVPCTVIALGIVSLSMDISSEMIHSLLPAFLVTVLGVSALSVGVIEGIAEATASITKIFSGAISDWIGKRKPLVLLGYGLAAVTKPLFPMARGVGVVLIARFVDRIGKGIRGAPRDALIADVTPVDLRGTAFGLRQSLDTVGAFVGPLLAMLLMAASSDNFRFVFWVAIIPAFFAVLLIVYGVQEPEAVRSIERRRFPIRRLELALLKPSFWWLIGVATVLTLARFSEAFLLLAAGHVGMAIALIPAVLVTMNVVYAAAAYPFGHLSDRVSRRTLLLFGIGFLMVADLVLATAGTVWQVLVGAAFWGLHMGATQGLLSTLVVHEVPPHLRGTAFGLYSLITGAALLVASVVAGWFWTVVGPGATFTAGAIFAGIAVVGIIAKMPNTQGRSD
ncbi:MAG TPA: MFS transporter [Candidatus Dormibacteraeota bacterium]|nr:MFS transporter [Candidatus Dormibacteraeota bacterium]